MADLAIAIEEDGHLVAPLLLQVRMAVHIDHLHLEGIAALELLQGREHVLAQVAILPGEHRQPGDRVNQRPGGTSRNACRSRRAPAAPPASSDRAWRPRR